MHERKTLAALVAAALLLTSSASAQFCPHRGSEWQRAATMAGPWMVTRECINTCSWPTWCWKNNVAAYDGLCTGYWKFNFW